MVLYQLSYDPETRAAETIGIRGRESKAFAVEFRCEGKPGQQRVIRRREPVAGEVLRSDPGQVGATQRKRLAVTEGTNVKPQVDRLFRIRMGHLGEESSDRHLNPQFLVEFANQPFLPGFPRFQLSSRELPVSLQVRSRRTLGDEQFPTPEDQSGGDGDPR